MDIGALVVILQRAQSRPRFVSAESEIRRQLAAEAPQSSQQIVYIRIPRDRKTTPLDNKLDFIACTEFKRLY